MTRLTEKEIEKRAKEKHPEYELASKEVRYSQYKNGEDAGSYEEKYSTGKDTYIGFICNKHGLQWITINSFVGNKSGCFFCGREQAGLKLQKDYVGQKFGDLLVIEKLGTIKQHSYYKVKCSCGKEFDIMGGDLQSGNTTSCLECGYKRRGLKNQKEYIGQKFGKLTPFKKYIINSQSYYDCYCDCGNIKYKIRSGSLSGEHTRSCGCLWKEAISKNSGGINKKIIDKNIHLANEERYLYLKKIENSIIKIGIGKLRRSLVGGKKNIILIYKGTTKNVSDFEDDIEYRYQDWKQEPIIKKAGHTECFSIEAERRIKCYIKRNASKYNLVEVNIDEI